MWYVPYATLRRMPAGQNPSHLNIYYKLMNKMADVPIVEGGSDFRLMNRKSLETLKHFREHGRFLRGIVGALGYRQAELTLLRRLVLQGFRNSVCANDSLCS